MAKSSASPSPASNIRTVRHLARCMKFVVASPTFRLPAVMVEPVVFLGTLNGNDLYLFRETGYFLYITGSETAHSSLCKSFPAGSPFALAKILSERYKKNPVDYSPRHYDVGELYILQRFSRGSSPPGIRGRCRSRD